MTFYHVRPGGGLDEIWVGKIHTLDGQEQRITSIEWRQADEDDPALGLKAGDYYCIVQADPLHPSEKEGQA